MDNKSFDHYSYLIYIFLICIQIGTVVSESTTVSFNGQTYIEYSPSKSIAENDYVNRIELSFRTVHPSGTLALLIGRYDDTLGLQLIQGKLR